MSQTIFSLLFLLAIGQGLLLCGMALRQTSLHLANRLLAALLLLFVLMIAHAWLGVQNLYRTYPHSAAAIATLPLLFGPLLWLYLRSLLLGQSLTRRDAWHALPFALALLIWLPYYLLPGQTKYAMMMLQQRVPLHILGFAAFKVLHIVGYVLFCLRLIVQVRSARPEQSLPQNLYRLTLLLGLGILLDGGLFALEQLNPDWPEYADTVGGLTLTLFVYGLAMMSMRLPDGYQPQPLAEPAKPRYANSLLSAQSEQQRQDFLQRLANSMEQEQLYRNGELKLEELAAHLAMTGHELSQLINEECAVNFQEYLNRFRVEALKQSLQDPAQQGATILDLALAAGFNSKSSLNRAFKKHTGSTPSEWRQAAQGGNQGCRLA